MIASAEADIREKAQFQGFLRRSLVVTDPVFDQLSKKDISEFLIPLIKIMEDNRGSFGRGWVAHIQQRLLTDEKSNQLSDRIEYWVRSLQSMADEADASGVDPTLARLMAQHFITAERLFLLDMYVKRKPNEERGFTCTSVGFIPLEDD